VVDLGALRGKLDGLEIGEITLQTFGAPNTVLIRIPQQPAGDAATQAAVTKLKTTLGDQWDYAAPRRSAPRSARS